MPGLPLVNQSLCSVCSGEPVQVQPLVPRLLVLSTPVIVKGRHLLILPFHCCNVFHNIFLPFQYLSIYVHKCSRLYHAVQFGSTKWLVPHKDLHAVSVSRLWHTVKWKPAEHFFRIVILGFLQKLNQLLSCLPKKSRFGSSLHS